MFTVAFSGVRIDSRLRDTYQVEQTLGLFEAVYPFALIITVSDIDIAIGSKISQSINPGEKERQTISRGNERIKNVGRREPLGRRDREEFPRGPGDLPTLWTPEDHVIYQR